MEVAEVNERREKAIALMEEIVDLRKRLKQAEVELDEILSSEDQGGRTPVEAAPRGTAAPSARIGKTHKIDRTLQARVLARAEQRPGQVLTVEDFQDLRGESSMQTLRSAIIRLVKAKKLRRKQPGRYKLAATAGQRGKEGVNMDK
jgi:hypothetical protein